MPSLSQYQSYAQYPQVRAFLDTIAWAEGGDYNRLYGGGTFSDLSRHPNRAITAGNYTSTAAGRYQFLKKTWDGIVRALGLSDFSAYNQDIGAIYLIWERGQLSNLLNGNIPQLLRGLGCLWAALPFSGCRQRERSESDTLNYYNRALAVYNRGVQNTASVVPSNYYDAGILATVDVPFEGSLNDVTAIKYALTGLAVFLFIGILRR